MEKKIVIISGAGISVDSGIPVYRGEDGLWENHKLEEVATYSTWKKNFEQVHDFYNTMRAKLEHLNPNNAHIKIAELSKSYNVINITQNIDDLFEKAGCKNVIHVHGELTRMCCEACGHNWSIHYAPFNIAKDRCPDCNSLNGVKPYVIFFGEAAPRYWNLHKAIQSLTENDVVLVIGTSGLVIDICNMLQNVKALKILNNMEDSQYIDDSKFDKVYYESSSTAIDKIIDDIKEKLG